MGMIPWVVRATERTGWQWRGMVGGLVDMNCGYWVVVHCIMALHFACTITKHDADKLLGVAPCILVQEWRRLDEKWEIYSKNSEFETKELFILKYYLADSTRYQYRR